MILKENFSSFAFRRMKEKSTKPLQSLAERHPIIANLFIIMAVAILGIVIVYFSIAIFTKHGETTVVPKIENTSYTEAIKILHEKGFRVDIRDSLFRDDVKPGYVIEQFPKGNSIVKPGRKIFLYINAVHPKEVVIDNDNNPREDALKSYSFRQGMAKLEELGFKNIRVVRVLGDNDCIVKILANGKVVKKMQKVPVNAQIVVEVYDGRLGDLRDSLQNAEYDANRVPYTEDYGEYQSEYPDYSEQSSSAEEKPIQSNQSSEEYEYY